MKNYYSEERKKTRRKVAIYILNILVLFLLFVIFYFLLATIMGLLKELMNFKFAHVFNYFSNPTVIIISFVLLAISLIYSLYLMFKKKKNKGPSYRRSDLNLYDKARFLTEKEINEYYGNGKGPVPYDDIANYDVNGLILNCFFDKNKLYFHRANGVHNLVVGTTGTGKTKCLLIPTVLMMAKSKNKPSMIVLDIKGEIIEKTYKTLEENNYDVHILDLRHPELSERYNPLAIIVNYYDNYLKADPRNKSIELNNCDSEINNLCSLVVPLSKGENKFWDDSARGIFRGIILGMLEDFEQGKLSKEQFTLLTIDNINSLQPQEFKKYFEDRPYESKARRQVNSTVLSNYEPTGEMNKTLASTMSTYITAYSQFVDIACQEITIKSDINISTIREKPSALFILVPDENKSRYPLASLIVNQVYSTLVNLTQKEGVVGKRDIHFILDEFANLPEFQNIDNWLSAGRERKMFISLFLQGIAQLENKYGRDKAKIIIQNCNMKICIGISENDDKKYFSDLFGEYTIVSQSSSTNSSSKNSSSISESLQKAKLVNETDLSEMELGEVYFIELKRHPGHTHLIPIFDEDFSSSLDYKIMSSSDRPNIELIEDKSIYACVPEVQRIKEEKDGRTKSSDNKTIRYQTKKQALLEQLKKEREANSTSSKSSSISEENMDYFKALEDLNKKISDKEERLKEIEEIEPDVFVDDNPSNSESTKKEGKEKAIDFYKNMIEKGINFNKEEKDEAKDEIIEENDEDLFSFKGKEGKKNNEESIFKSSLNQR